MSKSYSYTPRLMKTPDAARYLAISASTFRKLDVPRKMRGDNRLYDVRDLDAWADNLDYEGSEKCDINPADAAFGIAAQS